MKMQQLSTTLFVFHKNVKVVVQANQKQYESTIKHLKAYAMGRSGTVPLPPPGPLPSIRKISVKIVEHS